MSGYVSLSVLCTILVHSANCSCPTLQGVTFTELEHTTGADPDCYAIIDTPMTWDEANAHCKSIHSLLLAIDRSGEAEKIAEHLISAGYDTSAWFHLGLRRIESKRTLNISAGKNDLGKVGYTWVDGTLFSAHIEDYFNEEDGIFADGSAVSSAFQFRLSADILSSTLGDKHLTLGFMGGNRSTSLEVTANFVCDMDDDLVCDEKPESGAELIYKDSRMTPGLCSASCIAKGNTGYAFISGEECYCSDISIPSSVTRHSCDLSCKGEEWLSCGTKDESFGMYRTLGFHGDGATQSKSNFLSCDAVYGNGLLRKMESNGQPCGNDISDNYCERPDYIPVGGTCVYISTSDLPSDYQKAQFEVCGKQAHSDMFVFGYTRFPNSDSHPSYPAQLEEGPYGVGINFTDALTTFQADLRPHIPWLAGPTSILSGFMSKYNVFGGSHTTGELVMTWPFAQHITVGFPNYPAASMHMTGVPPAFENFDAGKPENVDSNTDTVYCARHSGDLGCVSIADIESGMTVPGARYIRNPSRLLNIYGCIEICRGMNNVDSSYTVKLAYVTDSACMCSAIDLLNETSILQDPSKCYGTPCPDPGTIQQCPSLATYARVFDLSMYPRLAVSCAQLWKNGAYDVGPYHIRLDKTKYDKEFIFLAHCTRVPVYMESSGVVQLASQTVGNSVPEVTQLRPELFSTDQWDFSGMGFHFNTNAADTLELTFVDGFHLIRGITLLGRGDLDVAGSDTYGLHDTNPISCDISFRNIANQWEDAIIAATGPLSSKGIIMTIALQPKIASAIAVKLIDWENKPIIRVEVIGDSLSSWKKVKQILDLRANDTPLGCYGLSTNGQNVVSPTFQGVPGFIVETVDKVKLYCLSEGDLFVVAEQLSATRTRLSCSNHMYGFYDRMDDMSLCEFGRCDSGWDQSTCDKFNRFVTLYEVHDEQDFTCPDPPTIPGSANLAWNGSNLIYHQLELLCDEPSSPDNGIVGTFTCQQNLTWNEDIETVIFPDCVPSCPDPPAISGSAKYSWNGTKGVGDQMTLLCNEPLIPETDADETFTCQQNLEWDNDIDSVTLPNCIMPSCADPPEISSSANYSWNGSSQIFQQMTLLCNELSSPESGIVETFTCQENLEWDKDIESVILPNCISHCPDPPAVSSSANYSWFGTNKIGHKMTMVCNEPLIPETDADETFTCQQNLEWDNDIDSVTLPNCILPSCADPPEISSSANYSWNGSSKIFQQMTLLCNELSSPESGIVETFTCQENLEWDKDIESVILPNCILPSCADPPEISSSANYSWNGSSKIFQQITLLCNELSSPESGIVETFTCQENLEWDKDIESVILPNCIYVKCKSQPPAVTNAHHEFFPDKYMDQTKVDEYLKYECDKGYEWENETAQRAQCLSDNIWALEFSDLLGCQPVNNVDDSLASRSPKRGSGLWYLLLVFLIANIGIITYYVVWKKRRQDLGLDEEKAKANDLPAEDRNLETNTEANPNADLSSENKPTAEPEPIADAEGGIDQNSGPLAETEPLPPSTDPETPAPTVDPETDTPAPTEEA